MTDFTFATFVSQFSCLFILKKKSGMVIAFYAGAIQRLLLHSGFNPAAYTKREIIMEFGGVLGLIVLILDIWAIVRVVGSGAGTGEKILWTLLIILLPVIGLIVWYVAGPK
jgi:phospholipase D-like protein